NLNRKRNVHLTTGSVGPRAWRRSHGPRGRDRPQRGHARLHRWFVQSTYGPGGCQSAGVNRSPSTWRQSFSNSARRWRWRNWYAPMPEFAFCGPLAFLMTLCVSLWFGAAPGLVSVIIGSLLAYVSALSPWMALRPSTWDETIGVILSAVASLLIVTMLSRA